MDGRDLVDLWENQHGKLTTDSRERFLASPEAQKIRAYPTDSIIRAIGVSPTLSKILLELQSMRRIQAKISPQAPKTTSPKPRQKAAPDYTRKIASERGAGFVRQKRTQRSGGVDSKLTSLPRIEPPATLGNGSSVRCATSLSAWCFKKLLRQKAKIHFVSHKGHVGSDLKR